MVLNPSCGRVRAPEHAPRGPRHLLERRHGLAFVTFYFAVTLLAMCPIEANLRFISAAWYMAFCAIVAYTCYRVRHHRGIQGRNQNIIGVNLGYLCRVRLKFNVKLK